MSEDRDDVDVEELDQDTDPPETDEDLGTDDDISDEDIDDGDDADTDADPEPERRPTRGETRAAVLSRERNAANERAERAERELRAERERQSSTTDAERQRQRNEHLATLTGDQRTDFLLAEQARANDAKLAKIQFDSWDSNDKAEFARKAAGNPALRGLDAEIEQALTTMRAQGTNAPRETVAAYIIGQRAMNKATRANNNGAKRQAAGEARNKTRPVGGRSDVAATRTRGDTKLEDRLRDVKL